LRPGEHALDDVLRPEQAKLPLALAAEGGLDVAKAFVDGLLCGREGQGRALLEPCGERHGRSSELLGRDAGGEEALALAHRIAEGPPLAHAEIKRAVRAGLGGTIDASLAMEKQGQIRCLTSADCMEGVMAWMQKRAPTFQGR
jgi:enoyl-CoA hydratase/carnithine racemase